MRLHYTRLNLIRGKNLYAKSKCDTSIQIKTVNRTANPFSPQPL